MRILSYLMTAAAVLCAAEATSSSKATDCCRSLAKELKGKVFYPNSIKYTERIEEIWSLSARQGPWCFVLPESTKDASTIMKTISKKQCPFGIRAGGHGTYAWSNSVEDGITIDFGHFNSTSYDARTSIVSFHPGAKSAPAYKALERHGVTFTGGRVGPVGASGFTAGGGNSYHSGSHGWACDNVVNFEVVLADGRIVNANKRQNRDLWIALRGSSGNFGLITRFDMRAIPYANPAVPHIFSGTVQYELSATETLVDEYVKFTNNTPNDQFSSAVFSWFHDSRAEEPFALRGMYANSANVQGAPALAGLLGIEGIISNAMRSDTMEVLTTELHDPLPTYNTWFTNNFKTDERVILYSQDRHQNLIDEIVAAIGPDAFFTTSLQWQPVTPTMVGHASVSNIMGLERHVAKGPGQLFLVWVAVGTADHESLVIPIVQTWFNDLVRYADSLGSNWNWQYLPYAHGLQDPISNYGKENIKKLRAASRKYDPKGVFQKLKSSGFKIPL